MKYQYNIKITVVLLFLLFPFLSFSQKDTTELYVGKKKLIIIDKKTQKENALYNLEKGKESFENEILIIKDNIEKDEQLLKIAKSDLKKINDSIVLLKNENQNKSEVTKQIQNLQQKYYAVQYNIQLLENDIEINRKKEDAFKEGIAGIEKGIRDIRSGMNVLDKELNKDKLKKEVKINEKLHSPFNAHWAGFEIGILNFINSNMSLASAEEMDYLVVVPEKTMSYGLNIFEYDVALSKSGKFGLATGAGLEWNSLALKNNINLFEDENGIIQAEYVDPNLTKYIKNHLNVAYVTIPVLFEYQTPIKYHKFYISAGVTGGIKAWSKQKQKWEENGQKYKNKKTDDFKLASFRYSATARIGYGDVGLFINFSPVAFFKENAGPELYPIAVGLKIVDF